MNAPIAKKIKKELTIHGDTRIDPYYWMKERENPDVRAYLEDENQYTGQALKHTARLQEDLYDEMVGRIKQTDMSVPYRLNGYYYYSRFEEGKEYPVYCRKKGSLESREEILLNVNELAEGHSYFAIGTLKVSTDNTLLAYSADTQSRRIYDIFIKDLKTGETLGDRITGTSGNLDWANDNRTIFYTSRDSTLRPDKVWKHLIGDEPEKDTLLYHEKDPAFYTSVYKSKSRKYMIIGSYSTLSTEYHLLKADDPEGSFQIFQPRSKNIEYYIGHFNDKFLIKTNYNARNFRLMEAPEGKTSIENWKEVIPHRDNVLLEDFEVFTNFLAILERKEGLTGIRIIDNHKETDYYIHFDEEVFLTYFSNNPEFDTDVLRIGYTSLTTPVSIFDFSMDSKERMLLKQQEVVGGYEPEQYKGERMWATAKDGKKIPISIVYKNGITLNADNPVLLYAYGSYGHSIDPHFSSVRISLLDRGFIFAIAHIRGGEEMGRDWYEDGKLLNKQNTFDDFISCAEFLIEKEYTSPGKLSIMGGSAGGLLIGAVINKRPELFKAAVAAVPFVDVVTTMLDESIPLTTGEYDEWGDPRKKEFYEYMLSYSPYDNVKQQNYPSLLVTTGFHDSQVQYWEPAKWVAKIRALNNNRVLALLHTNLDFGHSGASGRFQKYKDIALEYAFIIDQLNSTKPTV
jgi:oligopeptidase B